MKKIFVLLFCLLIILSGCGGKEEETVPVEEPVEEPEAVEEPEPQIVYVDITDDVIVDSGSSVQVQIDEAKYEILPNGSYRLYLTLKGPKGYNFVSFNSGPDEVYKSEFTELNGNTQEIVLTIPEKKLRQIDDLMASVFNNDDVCYIRLMETKYLFVLEVEDPDDGTYEYTDITEYGEADYNTLSTGTIELINYSYVKLDGDKTRFSVTFTSDPDMEMILYDPAGKAIGSLGLTESNETTIRFTIMDEFIGDGLKLHVTGEDGTGIIHLYN